MGIGHYYHAPVERETMSTEINEAELSADQPQQPTQSCKVIEPSTFRGIVKEVAGRNITSKQAANFLELFGQDIEGEVTKTIRGFVVRHFGKK